MVTMKLVTIIQITYLTIFCIISSCLCFIQRLQRPRTCCSYNHYLASATSAGICGGTSIAMMSRTSIISASATTPASTIQSYEEAISIIDQCSTTESPTANLYDAIRYIDKNANIGTNMIYPTTESKEQMWKKAHGSWKLVLATGGGKYTTFKPVPIFAYARIDESTFGNGVGLNENIILLSLLGPHFFDTKKRQMKICIDDIFLCSNNVTNMIPGFITKNINLKKRPEDFGGRKKRGDRIPAFTFIASSEKSLVARGGSGGIAIWTRLDKDIKTAAYGS